MKTSELDYELPHDRIAQWPLEDRSASRLLVVDRADGALSHHVFKELPALLDLGDLLVRNVSRVVPARLFGRRASGGRVELLLLEHLGNGRHRALARPAARLRPGEQIQLDTGLGVTIERHDAGHGLVEVAAPGLDAHARAHGLPPLPPYIRRPVSAEDHERYQTVYASRPGSIAAPTAGLHFTAELLQAIRKQKIELADVVLHIGPGTFLPIRVDDLARHPIHAERIEVTETTVSAIDAARARGRRVVAVGTTTTRALEAAALASEARARPLAAHDAATDLFITPGYRFRIVDALVTNFHQPRSTLLALVAAFAGLELIRHAYRTALEEGYRFLSYGDAMLIR